ncbi:PAS domain-containing protein [Rhizobium sp. AAP43]|uniref:PAS domain-containing protein n=1 Tax=Rhizobium sp. AAP43 TaxID=1523420 RepID=UPI0027D26651|nr:PAS domain-containing protein [Rhizobium sp. AAP43]
MKLIEERRTIGFWSCDVSSGKCWPSTGFYRILGLQPGTPFEISGIAQQVHPEDRVLVEDLWSMIRLGVPVNRDFRIIRSDRTVRWIELRSEIVLDQHDKPSRAIGMLLDVTAMHESRHALEDMLDRQKAMGSLVSMEWRISGDGTSLTQSNWNGLTGQNEMQAAGGGWLAAVHPEDQSRVASDWARAVSTNSPYRNNLRIRRADGIYEWFHARAVPIIKKGGQTHEWIGILIRTDEIHASHLPDDHSYQTIMPAQIRAARAILEWTLDDLSRISGVSVSSIRRIEAGGERVTRPASLIAIREAFEKEGLHFQDDSSVSFSRVRTNPDS